MWDSPPSSLLLSLVYEVKSKKKTQIYDDCEGERGVFGLLLSFGRGLRGETT